MFSWGGMKKMPRLGSTDFCFVVGVADTLRVDNSWYNRLAHKSSGQVVFIGSNGYFVQIRLVLVCVQRSSLLSTRKVVS